MRPATASSGATRRPDAARRMVPIRGLPGPAQAETSPMRIAVLTNEYPPHVYGGAGVHVEYLTRELARLDGGAHSVEVLCFGEQSSHEGNLTVHGVPEECRIPCRDPRQRKLMDPLMRDL